MWRRRGRRTGWYLHQQAVRIFRFAVQRQQRPASRCARPKSPASIAARHIVRAPPRKPCLRGLARRSTTARRTRSRCSRTRPAAQPASVSTWPPSDTLSSEPSSRQQVGLKKPAAWPNALPRGCAPTFNVGIGPQQTGRGARAASTPSRVQPGPPARACLRSSALGRRALALHVRRTVQSRCTGEAMAAGRWSSRSEGVPTLAGSTPMRAAPDRELRRGRR